MGHGKLSCTIVSEEACENVKGTSFSSMGESWRLRGYTMESFWEISFYFKLPSSYLDCSLPLSINVLIKYQQTKTTSSTTLLLSGEASAFSRGTKDDKSDLGRQHYSPFSSFRWKEGRLNWDPTGSEAEKPFQEAHTQKFMNVCQIMWEQQFTSLSFLYAS